MVWKLRTAVCQQCGKSFTGRFGPKRQFCSIACRQKYRNAPERNPAKTEEAKQKLSDTTKTNKRCVGRILSEETKARISASLKNRVLTSAHREAISRGVRRAGCMPPRNPHLVGPNHPNWNGGHAKERQAHYGEPEYQEFVRHVLERDAYTCQYCGARNGEGEKVILQVHHVKPWASYPELAYESSNGLTLCVDCHRHAHAGIPRPKDKSYHGKSQTCIVCGTEFRQKYGRKYCPECRDKYCCPVCGSTTCHHLARKNSKQPLPF